MINYPTHRPVRIELTADAEPGILPRIVTPFARRDLLVDGMRVKRYDTTLVVQIQIDHMPMEELHRVEGNLRQTVGVHRVEIELMRMIQAVG